MKYEVGTLEFSYLFIFFREKEGRRGRGGKGCPILQVQVYYLSTKRTYFLLPWGVGACAGAHHLIPLLLRGKSSLVLRFQITLIIVLQCQQQSYDFLTFFASQVTDHFWILFDDYSLNSLKLMSIFYILVMVYTLHVSSF